MTICAAWRDDQSIFVVADSMLTAMGPQPPPVIRTGSTFAEQPGSQPGRIQEIGCKVVRLSCDVVAGYAGASGPALGALIEIREHLRQGATLRDIVAAVQPASSPGAFKLLVGGGPRNAASLYVLSSDGTAVELYEERTPIVLGSLPMRERISCVERSRGRTVVPHPIRTRPWLPHWDRCKRWVVEWTS